MPKIHVARIMAGVWVLIATAVLSLQQATANIVHAPWGLIQGVESVSVSGLNYLSFLAIPYAVPPVGKLRFAKPVPHPGFGDDMVFNATTLGDQCLQEPGFSSSKVGFSEDCLTLNVFVPLSPSNGPKSVMVYIHGGRFLDSGAATYRPSELVTENDVITVVIQYRLDTLGFLSCAEEMVAGNFGLWDQNLAMRWVKTNIGAFGGDPESMTIFGKSAGAISVGFQAISPASKGMKFRAILMSGTPAAPWAINRNPCEEFYILASETGCLKNVVGRGAPSARYYVLSEEGRRAESDRLLACLRGIDGRDLIRGEKKRPGTTFISGLVWRPVVDNDFVPMNPIQLIRNVTYLQDVGATERDVMVGVVNEEGGFFVTREEFFLDNPNTPEGRREVLRRLLNEHLTFLFGEELEKEPRKRKSLLKVLEFFYTQADNNGDGTVSLQNLSNAFSDIAFILNAVEFLRELAKAKSQTQTSPFTPSLGRRFLYLFNHFPTSKADLLELTGTWHDEELSYVFDPMPELGDRMGFTDVEEAIGTIFRTMLASFSITGKPIVPLLDGQSSVIESPEFSLPEEEFLSLELESQVDNGLFGSSVALWNDLIPSLLKCPEPSRTTRYILH